MLVESIKPDWLSLRRWITNERGVMAQWKVRAETKVKKVNLILGEGAGFLGGDRMQCNPPGRETEF